eukprot:m.69199 g.69199  ORF g.69199 m.69199 type:complete len:329 (-) comp14232_c0_seq1:230-1216(-)
MRRRRSSQMSAKMPMPGELGEDEGSSVMDAELDMTAQPLTPDEMEQLIVVALNEDLAQQQSAEARITALRALAEQQIPMTDLLRLRKLLYADTNDIAEAALDVFCEQEGKMPLQIVGNALHTGRLAVHERVTLARCVRVLGIERADLWKEANDVLLMTLKNTTDDKIFNGTVLAEIITLHGMDLFDIDDKGTVTMPTHLPNKETVNIVRACFAENTIDPSICGGYIDFLERGCVPPDPSDAVVRSLVANTWLDPERDTCSARTTAAIKDITMADVKQDHEERLKELKEEWVRLQQKRRADSLSWTLTKALILAMALVLFELTRRHYEF